MSRLPVPAIKAANGATAEIYAQIRKAIGNVPNTFAAIGAYRPEALKAILPADSVLASAERSALVTLTHYSAQGSAEIAGASTDLILARHHGRLHLFSRDQEDPAKLVPSQWNGSNVHDTLAGLLT